MVQSELKIDVPTANALIQKYGNVRSAIENYSHHDNK